MIYPYITMQDETEVAFSEVRILNEKEVLTVYFEKPDRFGFKTAECILPYYKWNAKGITVDELASYDKFVKKNEPILYKFAKQGGVGTGA